MRSILIILTFTLTYGMQLLSQNLVPNGSFENNTNLPNSLADWFYCVGWNNVNLSTNTWPKASPDYFHTSGTGDANIPNSFNATVTAQSGNAIMGLYSVHSSQVNAREYIAAKLNSPLVVGDTYTISFWHTNGSANHRYGSSANRLGIQLTTSPKTQVDHELLGGTPQVQMLTDVWNTGWVQYSFTYVATSAFEYITIGNFYSDAATTKTVRATGASYPTAVYHYIDNVVIERTSPLPIGLVSFDAKDFGDYVLTSWETVSELNNDFFTVEHSNDTKKWTEVGVVDGAGNSTISLKYYLRDNNPFRNVTYYRLKQTDFDGKTSYSSIRTISRENNLSDGLKIYPNPTKSKVVIEGTTDDLIDFQIFNSLGQNMVNQFSFEINNSKDSYTINMSNLPNGVYFIKTKTATERIVKI